MPKEVVMPRLSDTMSEGTVTKWRKQVGEPVQKGEILVEIETDKAIQELESYDAGVLAQILVDEGATVPLGTPIALIALPGEAGVGAPLAAPVAFGAAEAPAPGPIAPTSAPVVLPEEERLRVSPIARRLAQEHGIDLRAVQGTGPGGRILREDVEAAIRAATVPAAAPPPAAPVEAAAPTAPPAPEVPPAPPSEEAEVFALNRMQQAIARRMVQSKVEAPHFYVTSEIDMTEAVAFRRSLNEALSGEGNVTFNDLILKAAALTLRRFPAVNASWDNGRLLVHRQVNVGFATAIPAEQGPGGLVVPVIHDADQKSLRQIAAEARALAEKARAGRITERELAGVTFSVSNLGMFDVDQFTAIISPPQSGILAVGAIVKKPVVRDDQIVVRDRMRVTLSVDHRVFYGATAAQFLQELKRVLEHPLLLV